MALLVGSAGTIARTGATILLTTGFTATIAALAGGELNLFADSLLTALVGGTGTILRTIGAVFTTLAHTIPTGFEHPSTAPTRTGFAIPILFADQLATITLRAILVLLTGAGFDASNVETSISIGTGRSNTGIDTIALTSAGIELQAAQPFDTLFGIRAGLALLTCIRAFDRDTDAETGVEIDTTMVVFAGRPLFGGSTGSQFHHSDPVTTTGDADPTIDVVLALTAFEGLPRHCDTAFVG
jgi:hypothetical protein